MGFRVLVLGLCMVEFGGFRVAGSRLGWHPLLEVL